MGDADFHNGELEMFMTECTEENLEGDELLLRVREDLIKENLLHSTNAERRKLRDYLDGKGVSCGKGTGDPIQGRLLKLIDLDTTTFDTVYY